MISTKFLATFAVATLTAFGANAAAIGYFSNNNASASGAETATLAAGHSYSTLGGLSAADLAGIDVLWVTNQSNSSQIGDIAANMAAITDFVSNGGVYIYNDREVTNAAASLINAGGFSFNRSTQSNIDVVDGSTALTNGPGGTIDNSTLDGGNSSHHGFALGGSLPAGATTILGTGNPGEIVDFTYAVGAGFVHYSSIPLDFYLDGGGSNGDSFRDIYSVNLVAYAAGLGQPGPAPVPLPASSLLLLSGFGVVFAARRKAKA